MIINPIIEPIVNPIIDPLSPYGGNLKGYNLSKGLSAYRAAVRDVDNNPIIVTAIGTSITRGKWASNIISTNYVGKLRDALQLKYSNVGMGNYLTPNTGESTSLTPWWTNTGTWTLSNRNMFAGGVVATATLVFTGTEADIIYQKRSNGSASGVTVTIDGVSKTAPDFYGSPIQYSQIIKYTGLSAAEHTMVITADTTASKYAFIEDVIVYNPTVSGQKGCYVFNFGATSASAGFFSPSASQIIPITGSHLVIIELGVNDTTDTTLFRTNMKTLISAIKLNATTSVLILSMYDWSATQATLNAMKINRQSIYALASQYDCAVLDIYSRWGKLWAYADSLGYWGSGTYNGVSGHDTIHPSGKGHADLANAILEVL